MGKIWHVFTIRELDNGFVVKVDDDYFDPVMTGKGTYIESLTSLIAYLSDKLRKEAEELNKAVVKND